MEISKLPPEMAKLVKESMVCHARNDIRQFADLTVKAVWAAPSPWVYGRFYLWHAYGDTLYQAPHIINESEDKKNYERMLNNDKEPALFRAMAAYTLASAFGLKDLETSIDYFRQVIEIVESMPAKDARRRVLIPSGEGEDDHATVREEANRLVELAKLNLQNFTNPTTAFRGQAYHQAVVSQVALHQQAANDFGFDCDMSNSLVDISIPSTARPPEMQKRLKLGGNSCDCCGKTLEQLGVVRLNCCSICKSAYYCGPDCQRKQWKAGHRTACRKPGEIKPNDLMKVRGLQSKPEWNERVVMALRVDPAKPKDRWIVRFAGGKRMEVSVAKTKLFHIRPAK